jgi:hypothetical protein
MTTINFEITHYKICGLKYIGPKPNLNNLFVFRDEKFFLRLKIKSTLCRTPLFHISDLGTKDGSVAQKNNKHIPFQDRSIK